MQSRSSIVMGLLLSLLVSSAVGAQTLKIAVIKSESMPLYDEVIASFKKTVGVPITVFDIQGQREKAKEIAEQLKKSQPNVLFTLGGKASYMGANLVGSIPMIYTMVLNPRKYGLDKDFIAGISLIVPAQRVFSKVKLLFPQINTVLVFVTEKSNQKQIEAAREGLSKISITMKTVELPIGEGTDAERTKLIDESLPVSDAIWMLPDPSVYRNHNDFLNISRKAQANRKPFVVYSDSFVQAGASMAIYPDYTAIGVQAAHMAKKILSGHTHPKKLGVQEPNARLVLNRETIQALGARDPYIKLKMWDDAIKEYSQLKSGGSSDLRVDMNLAQAYSGKGMHLEAITLLNDIVKKGVTPELSKVYLFLGRNYQAIERYDDAIKYYTTYLTKEPQSYESYYHIGVCWMEKNTDVMALDAFDKAIALNPSYAWPYYQKGRMFTKQGKLKEALSMLQTAMQLELKHYEFMLAMGTALRKIGEFQKALALHQNTLEMEPELFTSHVEIAHDYYMIRDYEKAVQHFLKALELNPRVSMTYAIASLNELAISMSEQNKDAQAIEHLKRALILEPRDKTTLINLAILSFKQGNQEEAIKFAQSLISNSSADPRGYYLAGIGYLQQGAIEKAIASLEEVKKRESTPTVPTLYALGVAHLKKGAFDLAVEYLEKALSLAGGTTDEALKKHGAIAHFNYGVQLLDGNQWIAAAKEFQMVLDNEKLMDDWAMLQSHFGVAYCYLKMNNNFPKVLRHLQAAKRYAGKLGKRDFPVYEDLAVYLAYAQMRVNSIDEVIATLEGHRDLKNPRSIAATILYYAVVTRGYERYLKGDLDGARKDIQMAVSVEPSNPIVQNNQACLEYLSKNHQKAAATFNTLKDRIPEALANYAFYLDDVKNEKLKAYEAYVGYLATGNKTLKEVVDKEVEKKRRIFNLK